MLTREELLSVIVKEDEVTRNCFFDFVEQLSRFNPTPESGMSEKDLNIAYTSALEAVADYRRLRGH